MAGGIAMLALAGGLIGLAVAPAFASGTDYYVATTGSNANNCTSVATPCLTIAGAILKASSGDTINVAAGTYSAASTVIANKSLTILGDPGTPDVVGPGPNAPVIDGGNTVKNGFQIANGTSGVTISGFWIKNLAPSGFINGSGVGIQAYTQSTGSVTVSQNRFTNVGYGVLVGNDGSGVKYALGTHSNWTISGNIIENVYSIGIEITDTSDSSVIGNVVHMSQRSPAHIGPIGIFSWAHISQKNLTVSGNTIDGTRYNYPAIYMYAYPDKVDMPYSGAAGATTVLSANLDDVTIANNRVTATLAAGGTAAYQVRIRGINRASDNAPGTVTNVEVQNNLLETLAEQDTTSTILATNNYWGQVAGPLSGQTSGNLTTSPWIAAFTPDPAKSATLGFWPTEVKSDPLCTTTCYVDATTGRDDYPGSAAAPFKTIQQGISAVSSGGTVHVAAGAYAEALTIGKSLTLEGPYGSVSPNDPDNPVGGLPGENGGRTAEAILAPPSGAGDAITIASGVPNLDIFVRGMTVDLAAAADGQMYVSSSNATDLTLTFVRDRFLYNPIATNGSWYLAGGSGQLSLTLTDNRFTGEREATNGIASYHYGPSATTVLDFRDNVWVDNKGWAFNGGATSGTSGWIVGNWIGNTTSGTSQVEDFGERQSGFLLQDLHDGLVIGGNTFVNIEYAAVNFFDEFEGPVSIENNLFDGYSNMGFYYDDPDTSSVYEGDLLIGPCPRGGDCTASPDLSQVTLRDNAFEGGTVGSVTVAVRGYPGDTSPDARGNWWGCSAGPNTTCGSTVGPILSAPFISAYSLASPPRTPGFWPTSKTLGLAASEDPVVVPVAGAALGNPSITIPLIPSGGANLVVEVSEPTVDETATPFTVDGAVLVDISVSGVTGPFTVCLNGSPVTDRLWHYEGGAWVDITGRLLPGPGSLDAATYPPGQICGMTDTLSPFAAAPGKPVLTVTPDPQSITFGDPAPSPYGVEVTGFIAPDTASGPTMAAGYEAPTCGSTYTQGDDAGTYTITCSGGEADDYVFDYEEADLTVAPAPLVLTVTGSQTYGAESASFDATYGPLPAGVTSVGLGSLDCTALDDGSGTEIPSATLPVGTYTIDGDTCDGAALDGAGKDNYEPAYTGDDYTVDPATLTVTPDPQTLTFGDPTPTDAFYTFDVDGFANGETRSGMTKAAGYSDPACASTYAQGDAAGSYPGAITCSGGAADNYTFDYDTATLTVESLELSPTDTWYTGQRIAYTKGSSSTTTQVTLTASITPDLPGDESTNTCFGTSVTDGTVTFTDQISGKVLAKDVAIAEVGGDCEEGIATAYVTLSTGTYYAQPYVIVVDVHGSLMGDNDDQDATTDEDGKMILVSMPPDSLPSGLMGLATLPWVGKASSTTLGSESVLAGIDETQTVNVSFGFTYGKRVLPKGNATIVIPTTTPGQSYLVKTNSITSVTTTLTSSPKVSTIYAKANVCLLTDAGCVAIEGNLSVRIDLSDGPDAIGVTVQSSKTSVLYYSNNWVKSGKAWATTKTALMWPDYVNIA